MVKGKRSPFEIVLGIVGMVSRQKSIGMSSLQHYILLYSLWSCSFISGSSSCMSSWNSMFMYIFITRFILFLSTIAVRESNATVHYDGVKDEDDESDDDDDGEMDYKIAKFFHKIFWISYSLHFISLLISFLYSGYMVYESRWSFDIWGLISVYLVVSFLISASELKNNMSLSWEFKHMFFRINQEELKVFHKEDDKEDKEEAKDKGDKAD